MSVPFFSVLLPTKNRSVIVGDAIRSVLGQTFPDLELIVSDNDDSATATRDVVATFNDPRIRYHRTSGTLPMHENWETAFNLASGRHVLVIEDKQVLNSNALETLHRLLQAEPDAVISYPVVITGADSLAPVPADLKPIRMPAEALLDSYCRIDEICWQYLPRGLNSCTPRALLVELQKTSPTGMIYSYVAPDHSQAYQVLSRVPEILHLPGDVIFIPTKLRKKGAFSNGASCFRKDETAKRWFAGLPVKPEDITANVPVKTHWMPLNIVLYDFSVFLRRPGYTPKFNWVRYHGNCLLMILLGLTWRCNMRPEIEATRDSLKRNGVGFTLRVLLDLAGRLWAAVLVRLRPNRRL